MLCTISLLLRNTGIYTEDVLWNNKFFATFLLWFHHDWKMMVPLLLRRVHLLTSTLTTQNSVTFCLPYHHQVPLLGFLSPSSKSMTTSSQIHQTSGFTTWKQMNKNSFPETIRYFTYESSVCSQNLLIYSRLLYPAISPTLTNWFVWRKPTWMVAFHRSSPALRLLLEVLLSSSHLATYRTTLGISLNLSGPHFFPTGCAKLFLSFLPAPGFNYFILTVLNVL